MLEPDRDTRIRLATEAMAYAASVKELLRTDGLPAEVLSAGGTGTYNITGGIPPSPSCRPAPTCSWMPSTAASCPASPCR